MSGSAADVSNDGIWRRALGDAFEQLHPGLADYFSAVPAGFEGRGVGVFERVGTPRRWLWPLLAMSGLMGIVWPRWETAVPFRVVNRAVDGAVVGARTFAFASGERSMVDVITVDDDGTVIEDLGRRRRLRSRLSGRALSTARCSSRAPR